MSNSLVYRRKTSTSDILIEYRSSTESPQYNRSHVIEDFEGEIIDLETLICYSSLEEWLNALH